MRILQRFKFFEIFEKLFAMNHLDRIDYQPIGFLETSLRLLAEIQNLSLLDFSSSEVTFVPK